MESATELDLQPSYEYNLPAPAVDALSAGIHISSQEIADLSQSDVEKSLSPAPSYSSGLEKRAYLDTPSPTNSNQRNGTKTTLDPETKTYFLKMHIARRNFLNSIKNINDLKKGDKPSLEQLKQHRQHIKRYAFRFSRFQSLSSERLRETGTRLDPSVSAAARDDLASLSKEMDQHFKTAIKSKDLTLSKNEASQLGSVMDATDNNLREMDNTSPDLGRHDPANTSSDNPTASLNSNAASPAP